MDETKTPIAGEYWFPKSGKPYLCIAANDRGDTVWQDHAGVFFLNGDNYYWKHWKHEPRCNGFDWVSLEPMAEVKKPKAGEYWVTDDGVITFVVGLDFCGDPVHCNSLSELHGAYMVDFLAEWHHEPSCDSFDWVSPTDNTFEYSELSDGAQSVLREIVPEPVAPPAESWPKWYAHTNPKCSVKRTSDRTCDYYELLRDGLHIFKNTQIHEAHKLWIKDGTWREVTEAEALARITPVEVWPKWYVPRDSSPTTFGAIKRETKTKAVQHRPQCTPLTMRWDLFCDDSVAKGDWIEVTEAEALARANPSVTETRTDTEGRDVTDLCGLHDESDTVSPGNAPPETFTITPATVKIGEFKVGSEIPDFRGESPEDWVEFTEPEHLHVLRGKGIDQCKNTGSDIWAACVGLVGKKISDYCHAYRFRCRRKDFPGAMGPFAYEMAAATAAIRKLKEASCGESPDDWVTQDRVPVRVGDECWWGNSDYSDEKMWWSVKAGSHTIGMVHGVKHKTSRHLTLDVRCRRKDLPEAQPAVKRVPVRLWCRYDRNYMSGHMYIFADANPPVRSGVKYSEIHSGENGGWYVEVAG